MSDTPIFMPFYMPPKMSETWGPINDYAFVVGDDGRSILHRAWQCRENGKIRWEPVRQMTKEEAGIK